MVSLFRICRKFVDSYKFTGCSRVLQGALAVNPWNTGQVVAACERCCRMSIPERQERFIKDFTMSLYCANDSGDSISEIGIILTSIVQNYSKLVSTTSN